MQNAIECLLLLKPNYISPTETIYPNRNISYTMKIYFWNYVLEIFTLRSSPKYLTPGFFYDFVILLARKSQASWQVK